MCKGTCKRQCATPCAKPKTIKDSEGEVVIEIIEGGLPASGFSNGVSDNRLRCDREERIAHAVAQRKNLT